MNPFEMVLGIVLFVSIASVLRAMIQHRRDRVDTAATFPNPEAERLREEVRALKERVATLERIATDGSASLDREIEALRHRNTERLDR